MPRYVAFLRGVSPMNARMPELKRCFETAGFTDVRTILSSGNVAFSSRAASSDALARRAGKAMAAELDRSFGTFVRPAGHLQELLESNPFAGFDLPPNAKLIVTFLRQAVDADIALPIERDGAAILKVAAAEAFACYVPGDKGPVFMRLLERTFGTDITTRTLDTVRKCARAQAIGSRIVCVSGQVSLDEQGSVIGEGDLSAQAAQCYRNLFHALEGAGATFDHVAKVTVYVPDWSSDKMQLLVAGAMRAAQELGFDPRRPMTLIGVSALSSPNLLIEVEAMAVLP